jgi:hypothetical protein
LRTVFVGASFFFFVSSAAFADEPRLAHWQLVVDGPPGCIDASELRQAVSATLTREAFADSAPDGTLRAKLSQVGHSWRATVSLVTSSGRALGAREITREASSCRALDPALVLVTSMLVDAARGQEPDPIPMRAEPAAELAARRDEPVPPRATQPNEPPTTFAGGLGVAFSLGFLPTVALAPMGWLRLAHGHALAGEVAAAWFPRAVEQATPGGVFDGGWISLGYCPALISNIGVEVTGCVRGAGAWMRGQGTSVRVSETTTIPFGEVGLGARASAHLVGPLWIGTGVDGWGALGRPRFTVLESGVGKAVFTPSPVYLSASLGLELHTH